MNSRQPRTRSPQLILAAAKQWDGRVGVGTIFRGRDGFSTHKLGFVSESTDIEEALYRALLDALDYATEHSIRGLVVYVDDDHVARALDLQAEVPDALRPWFAQVRCRANALWPTRFEVAPIGVAIPARRLAQDALQYGQTLNLTHDTALLPLSFSQDLVA